MTLSRLYEALNETCAIERGSVLAPTVTAGVACLACPPQETTDTAALRLLIVDTDRIMQVGWRVVYRGRRFVIQRISADHDGLTDLECAEFNEPA